MQHGQHRPPRCIPRQARQRRRKRLGRRQAPARGQAGDRREAHQIAAPHDPSAGSQFRLALGQHIPDIAVHAAAIGQPRGDGADDVAVPVGEEGAAEERLRRRPRHGQQMRGDEPAGIAVGVGESVDAAVEILPDGAGRVGGGDEVGAVERRRKHRELVPMAYEREAADPGRRDLAGQQQRHDLLVGSALDQHDRGADACRKLLFHGGEQHEVGLDHHRRQAERHRLDGLGRRERNDVGGYVAAQSASGVSPRTICPDLPLHATAVAPSLTFQRWQPPSAVAWDRGG